MGETAHDAYMGSQEEEDYEEGKGHFKFDPDDKPDLELVGEDGNAWAIMGNARLAASQAKWSKEKIDFVLKEAMDGDYDHLLQTMMKYFEVT